MMAILALFYATDDKPLAMLLMRTVNPLSSALPWFTHGMRLSVLNARLYDVLVVLVAAFQGFVVGSIVDAVSWFRRRQVSRASPLG